MDHGSTSAFSNIALNIEQAMKHCLQSVFGGSLWKTVEGLCDLIHTQWLVCKPELIPEDC